MPLKINPATSELDLVINPGGGIAATSFDTDSGTATPAAGGTITIAGGTGINTAGATSTVTINLDDPVIAGNGGTGRTSLTDGAILIGDTTNPVELIGPLTDGQLLIGDTGGVSPSAASLTQPAAGITITGGAGSITFALANDLAAVEGLGATGIAARTAVDTWNTRTITGTTGFIAVTDGDGVAGNPTIDIAANFEATGMHGWNGSFLETVDVDVTSSGSAITLSIEQTGGGDLTAVFSDGYYDWDTTPAATVTLTAGSDTSPQINYIYFLQSTKLLTNSTTSFPATEHAPVATVLCQSAASLQTDGPYKVHVWTDHITEASGQGHTSHIRSWIRSQNSTWVDGVAQTYTITPNGGAADNVILTTASGNVLQLHSHTFPAFGGTPDVYVVNDSVTAYNTVTDLNALLTDSAGVSMSGRYFSLVIWGVVSEDTADCKLYCNLPGGSYTNQAGVEEDALRHATYDIPAVFKGTGFLISEWKLRHQVAASGTWTSIDEIDLRGQFPSVTAGGGLAPPTEFIDNVFRILDEGDTSKEIAFQASGITTATTRTITMADQNIDLTPTSGSYQASDAELTAVAGLSGTGLVVHTAAGAMTERTITGGAGITVTNGDGVAGAPDVALTSPYGGGLTWTEVTDASVSMAVGNGYILNNAGLLTATLPATAAVGSVVRVVGKGAGKWRIAQNAGDIIHFGTSTSTTGAGGRLDATEVNDCVELVCIVADNEWAVMSSIGNVTVT